MSQSRLQKVCVYFNQTFCLQVHYSNKHTPVHRFKRAAFYQGLESKVGLAAAKLPLALPFSSPSFFHTISLSPPPSFTQYPLPCVH
jgi:hypothetical protein